MRLLIVLAVTFIGIGVIQASVSDGDIRAEIVNQSIAAYTGSCPCPFSRTRNGQSCGKRSAYYRRGGKQVLCYPKDVSQKMVYSYRKIHAQE